MSHAHFEYEKINTQDHSDELGHQLPFKMYIKIFITLLFLTALTVGVTRLDFGAFNFVVAFSIASVKALLVALFFMHLRYENPLTWVYAGLPIVLLAILIGLLFIDNPYREVASEAPAKPTAVAPLKPAVNQH